MGTTDWNFFMEFRPFLQARGVARKMAGPARGQGVLGGRARGAAAQALNGRQGGMPLAIAAPSFRWTHRAPMQR